MSARRRRRSTPARAFAFSGLVALVAGASACSVLLDWNGLTGGGKGDIGATLDATPPRDGAIGDGAASASDASVLDGMITPCTGGTCAPNYPSGWLGPVSLYVGASAPPCSVIVFEGYEAPVAAPPDTCAPCACEAPAGVTCADPVLSFFLDPSCTKVDPTTSTISVSTTCTPTAIAGIAATLAGPTPTGGSCTATGGKPMTTPPTTWKQSVRACAAMTSGNCAGGDLCVTSTTDICIMQSGSVTACPAGYPVGPQIFYTGTDDTRNCGACTCSPPGGGACTIGSPAVDVYQDFVCTTPSAMLMAPNACTSVTGFVKLVGTPALADAGACSVADGGMPTGTATPSGATSFCCLH